MADPVALSQAFMRAHPGEAARVLEAMPVAAAAALFAQVPVRLGASVLSAMLPGAAARSVGALDDERAMSLLAALGALPAAAVLRQFDASRRARLIDGLPTATALASRLLLGYPEDSVGAWADPRVIALAPEVRAVDALERVRNGETEVAEVFVVGASQRLQGHVPVTALLRAPSSASLESLAVPTAGVLAAHTPLAGATHHPAWASVASVPVVETGDRLLGVLTHGALHQALHRAARTAARVDDESLAGLAARSYWEALSGIAEVALSLLPTVRSVESLRDER